MTNEELITAIRKNVLPGSNMDEYLDELEERLIELEDEVNYFRHGGDIG